ncbi:zinc finger protein 816 isoform X2 [Stomoxys calcitrans]|uniref:C2H2-type domain-containing protein n=1 Tax=Stomoxys calcitrans TaxID=35570 RepID=A0A1I8Q2P8_STOCA|nr:zinc finger protein 816 isoform X2 [Stomoxys calcitrans]XP_059222716.1 zinc finger protein 816 isoform X2 [Stomoxys calcitrans]XP_059222717.1 zinc finger protein 816 isoform X2 [Stomoxys calcitrans]
MLKHPPPSGHCRLCVKNCNDHHRSLYDETGQANANHDLVGKYFTNAMLNMEWEGHLHYVCGKCWQYIWEFHQFQQSVIEAQKVATKEFEQVVKVKSEQEWHNDQDFFSTEDLIKSVEEQLDLHNDQEFVNSEDLMKSTEEQLEWHNVQEFIASYEDLVKSAEKQSKLQNVQEFANTGDLTKATPLTFVIKSEDPLDLNNDYEEMSLQDGHHQLADEEMAHMASSKENTSLRQDDAYNDDYSSNNEIPSSSLDQTNLCSSEEFDELVALWRTSLRCEICHQLVASYSQLEEHFKKQHASVVCYLMCCQMKLEYRYDIEQHIHYHNAPKHLRCETCCKSYRFVEYLRNHIRKVHTREGNDKNAKDSETLEGNYHCDKCPKTFAKNSNLRKHSIVHKPTTLECNICGKSFSSKSVMREHLARHMGEKKHGCSFCPKAFTRRSYIGRHMRASHPQEWKKMQNEAERVEKALPPFKDNQMILDSLKLSEIMFMYTCPVCCRLYETKRLLHFHIRRMHQNRPANINLQALNSFCSLNKFLLFNYLIERTSKGAFRCKVCFKECESTNSLSNHITSEHPKIAKLEQESMATTEDHGDEEEDIENIQLEDHIIRMDSFKRYLTVIYKCKLCPKLYEEKRTMFAHLRRTHKQSFCHDSIITRFQTEGKETEVASRTKFRCDLCSTEYENRSSILSHVRKIHKRTTQKLDEATDPTYTKLLARLNVATVEIAPKTSERKVTPMPPNALYKCPFCPKQYKTNSSLNVHTRRNHKNKTQLQYRNLYEPSLNGGFRCKICSKLFKKKYSLYGHIWRLHPHKFKKGPQVVEETPATTNTTSVLYRCKFCTKTFDKIFFLNIHLRRTHNKGSKHESLFIKYLVGSENPPRIQYKCKLCFKEYDNRYSIYSHVRMIHNQDTLYNKIVVTKTTDETNTGADNVALNKEEETVDSLMSPVEGKESKDANATSSGVKIEEFSPESYTLGNEKMEVNEMPPEFEDVTWETEEFIKSENEFIDL